MSFVFRHNKRNAFAYERKIYPVLCLFLSQFPSIKKLVNGFCDFFDEPTFQYICLPSHFAAPQINNVIYFYPYSSLFLLYLVSAEAIIKFWCCTSKTHKIQFTISLSKMISWTEMERSRSFFSASSFYIQICTDTWISSLDIPVYFPFLGIFIFKI